MDLSSKVAIAVQSDEMRTTTRDALPFTYKKSLYAEKMINLQSAVYN
jgi:hypothetical protein